MDKEQSIAYAKKFIEDILSFFGENIAVEASYNDDILSINIASSDLNSILIGRNAETLRSLQYIVSTVLRNNDAAITRVIIDIADYKKQREEKIAEKARGWIEEVRQTGDSLLIAGLFTVLLPIIAIFALIPKAKGVSVISLLHKLVPSSIIISTTTKGFGV